MNLRHHGSGEVVADVTVDDGVIDVEHRCDSHGDLRETESCQEGAAGDSVLSRFIVDRVLRGTFFCHEEK
jgi:hypothetical protein